MYCSSNNQVTSSMLLGQRRRRPVCHMLKVDILGRQDHRESPSAVDGALRCYGSAGTVQTSERFAGCLWSCGRRVEKGWTEWDFHFRSLAVRKRGSGQHFYRFPTTVECRCWDYRKRPSGPVLCMTRLPLPVVQFLVPAWVHHVFQGHLLQYTLGGLWSTSTGMRS